MPQAALINFANYYRQNDTNLQEVPIKKEKKNNSIVRKKSYNLKSLSEVKDVMDYMLENKMYIHYLIFGIQFNTGRRISDVVGKKDTPKRKGKQPLKWTDFYEADGKRKMYLQIKREQKTSKAKDILINDALWKIIDTYCSLTGCEPTGKNSNDFITLQFTGTHKGRNLSYEAYRQALEKVEKECEIKRKFRSNSAKKSMGYLMKKLNPTDEFSTAVISGFFNHSSEAVTRRYIGIDQEKEDEYVSMLGDSILSLMDGKEISMPDRPTDLVTIEYDDLRQIIQLIYQCGRENADGQDLQAHLDNIDIGMNLVREYMK